MMIQVADFIHKKTNYSILLWSGTDMVLEACPSKDFNESHAEQPQDVR